VAQLAQRYLAVTVHSLLLGLGMASAALLRAGDARRHQWSRCGGPGHRRAGPDLIFGLDLGLDGATIASVLSRMALAAVGLRWCWCATACCRGWT
jgi:Na+-driven multidrug efflux pump